MNKIAHFEKVSEEQFYGGLKKIRDGFSDGYYKNVYDNIILPQRATTGSAGHDIASPIAFELKPNQEIVIPLGIRCVIDEGYVMLVFPRSSMGIKHGLYIKNTVPVIDSDYSRSDNEGHIYLCVVNGGDKSVCIYEGDRIAQAMFVPFGVADTEKVTVKRNGGIGSTD